VNGKLADVAPSLCAAPLAPHAARANRAAIIPVKRWGISNILYSQI
jgi:hypothetical protein